MARRFTSSRRVGLQAPKRQIANDGIVLAPTATLTFLATSNAKAVFSSALALVIPAATLVRTRGMLHIQMLSNGTASNTVTGAVGLMVVSNESFVAGIASLRTPLEEIESAWYVYEPFAMQSVGTGTQDGGSPGRFLTIPFDSRGQRKLKNADTLVAVIEANQTSATTGTVLKASLIWRSQFKL